MTRCLSVYSLRVRTVCVFGTFQLRMCSLGTAQNQKDERLRFVGRIAISISSSKYSSNFLPKLHGNNLYFHLFLTEVSVSLIKSGNYQTFSMKAAVI